MNSRIGSLAYTKYVLVSLAAAVLVACGAPSTSNNTAPATAPASIDAPTTVPVATSAPAATAKPTSVPATTVPATSVPVPSAEPAALLPAPLYMLNEQQQIVRLEANGTTAAPITTEQDPIVQFSVSQASGAILYVVGQLGPLDQPATQRLVSVDAHGGSRVELLKGALFAPTWMPDGQRYAVTWHDAPAGAGVYVGSAAGGDPVQLVADVPFEKQSAKPGLRYSPLAWSPDGKTLLLAVAPDYGPEAAGGDISVLGLAVSNQDAEITTLLEPGGGANNCFDASWSNDGASIYCANYGAFGDQPGLWRLPAAGGKPEVLLAGTEGQQTDVFNARQIGGQIYAFVGQFGNGTSTPMYAMQRFDSDNSAPTKLRSDTFDATAVLWSTWAPDASGAVIQKAEEGQPTNALIWAPSGDGTPITLTARAFGAPQWGAPRP